MSTQSSMTSVTLTGGAASVDTVQHDLCHTHSGAVVQRCVNQGSCASLECKASFKKSLNFRKLKKSLNCYGKRVEGLEKFEICIVLDDLVTVHTSCHSCCKTG